MGGSGRGSGVSCCLCGPIMCSSGCSERGMVMRGGDCCVWGRGTGVGATRGGRSPATTGRQVFLLIIVELLGLLRLFLLLLWADSCGLWARVML